jgi:hypothetical protein
MKKLQLKIRDLKNPSILSHREIRNIMGGDGVDGSGKTACTCTLTAETGEKLDFPNTCETEAACYTLCETACKNAGHCSSYDATFAS